MNQVNIIGNLGRDPELRATQSGVKVTNFSVATTERWRDREGQLKEQTEWHAVVCWGRQAEIAKEFLTKGRQVAITGKLRTRSWVDQQSGDKRYRTEIQCDRMEILGKRPAESSTGADAEETQVSVSEEQAA